MNNPAPPRSFWERHLNTVLKLILVGVVLFVGFAMILPSTGHPRWVFYRMESTNNLKQIGLALHNYHDTYRQFPPAYTVDKQGKPLHSWRVLLLPFLEEEKLYEKFDLNAPWSSEANRKLISEMPDVYTSPFFRDAHSEGKTPYLALVDEFEGRTVLLPKKGRKLSEIEDGMSNSAMVVDDITHMPTWTQPDDWDPLELLTVPNFDDNEMHAIQVLLADGSCQAIGQANRNRLIGMIYCNDKRIPPPQ